MFINILTIKNKDHIINLPADHLTKNLILNPVEVSRRCLFCVTVTLDTSLFICGKNEGNTEMKILIVTTKGEEASKKPVKQKRTCIK